jgi:peptide/nickel transport system substrate-binding protein
MIHWAEPYIHANVLSRTGLPPLPRHLLEDKYRASRSGFTTGDEWTASYVGSGPFRLERWEPGTRILARAHPGWLLGPPRLESLEIRFLSDPNTLLANILAGEVDFATSPAIRLQDGLVAQEQWVSKGLGYLKTWEARLKFLEFQYREVPNWQRVVTDVRIRQALTHALDRASLAHAMTDGLSPMGEAFILPSDPLATDVNRAIVRYPFDPRRATAILAEVGWHPGPSGLLSNTSGQTLDVEVSNGSSEPQAAAIIADNWKGAGINSSVFVLPLARQRDREFRASFPGTSIGERSVWLSEFTLISSRIPTAESGWAEFNRGSFSDLEVDRLHSQAVTSFDEGVRRQATIALHRRLSEIAAYTPLYFGAEVLLARSRLKGPVGNFGPEPGVTWNVFEWEIVG